MLPEPHPYLVAGAAAGAFQRLLDGVAGKYAESYRHAGFQRCLGNTTGAFAGHIIEMRRLAADYRTQGNYCILPAAGG